MPGMVHTSPRWVLEYQSLYSASRSGLDGFDSTTRMPLATSHPTQRRIVDRVHYVTPGIPGGPAAGWRQAKPGGSAGGARGLAGGGAGRAGAVNHHLARGATLQP